MTNLNTWWNILKYRQAPWKMPLHKHMTCRKTLHRKKIQIKSLWNSPTNHQATNGDLALCTEHSDVLFTTLHWSSSSMKNLNMSLEPQVQSSCEPANNGVCSGQVEEITLRTARWSVSWPMRSLVAVASKVGSAWRGTLPRYHFRSSTKVSWSTPPWVYDHLKFLGTELLQLWLEYVQLQGTKTCGSFFFQTFEQQDVKRKYLFQSIHSGISSVISTWTFQVIVCYSYSRTSPNPHDGRAPSKMRVKATLCMDICHISGVQVFLLDPKKKLIIYIYILYIFICIQYIKIVKI